MCIRDRAQSGRHSKNKSNLEERRLSRPNQAYFAAGIDANTTFLLRILMQFIGTTKTRIVSVQESSLSKTVCNKIATKLVYIASSIYTVQLKMCALLSSGRHLLQIWLCCWNGSIKIDSVGIRSSSILAPSTIYSFNFLFLACVRACVYACVNLVRRK